MPRAKPAAVTAKRKREEKKTQPSKKNVKKEEDSKDEVSESKEEEEAQPVFKAVKIESSKSSSSALDWLLSDAAFDLANPFVEIGSGKGEKDLPPGGHVQPATIAPPEDAGKHMHDPSSSNPESKPEPDPETMRYPASHLTPFQNLISALILSKPLSHRLGLRTIQTLLNPPFSIRTLSDLDEAGYEGRRRIMWDARTQHKEKTASQLGDLVDGVREICGADSDEEDLSELRGVREKIEGMGVGEAQEEVGRVLRVIKGIGPGVVGIFLRRVQGDWQEVFPFADERGLKAARMFGLVGEGDGAEALRDAVRGEGEEGESGAEEGRRRYVRVLDTLVGLELEKKVEEGMKMAGLE